MPNSPISNQALKDTEAISAREIREQIFDLIRAKYPTFGKDDYISVDELKTFRRAYMNSLMAEEAKDLAVLDADVMQVIRKNSIMTESIEEGEQSKPDLSQRMADKIASFGGSWKFIFIFFSFILIWMLINILLLMGKAPFDPYPFILLNLILSCLAAIQAPIIMMSQNRQEEKDRIRAENDYKINRKAEQEIKLLSEKIDHLLVHHNKKLLEIQQLQIDYLEDLMNERKTDTK